MSRSWQEWRDEYGGQDGGPPLDRLIASQKRSDARRQPAIRCRGCGHSVGPVERQVEVERCVMCCGTGGADDAAE